jgi:hypothetical protein
MNNKLKVINFISGPGSGKSTLVSFIYGELKLLGYDIETVHEYAKTLVLQKRFEELNNQYYVSNKQYKLLKSYKDMSEIVITDGSLLHGLHYNISNIDNVSNLEKTEKAIMRFYNDFENINIFLDRHDKEYDNRGRIENLEGAIIADNSILNYLDKYNIDYFRVKSDILNIPDIIAYINEKLNKKEK